jgi:hypothetical protein
VTYLDQKSKYPATIKREKIKTWNEYCNLTTKAKAWNALYRLAGGKMGTNTQITTLRNPDGSLTRDTKETLRHMLEYFTPEYNELETKTITNKLQTRRPDRPTHQSTEDLQEKRLEK